MKVEKKVEKQIDLLSIIFCQGQDLENLTICGKKLCWKSDEKVNIVDVGDLEELSKGKEDEDGFIDFKSKVIEVPLSEKVHGKLTAMKPCTPAYILHLIPEVNLSAEILEKCQQYLKLVCDKKVLIL